MIKQSEAYAQLKTQGEQYVSTYNDFQKQIDKKEDEIKKLKEDQIFYVKQIELINKKLEAESLPKVEFDFPKKRGRKKNTEQTT